MTVFRRDPDLGVVEMTTFGYALRALLDMLDRCILEAALLEDTPERSRLDDQLHALRTVLITALRHSRADVN